MPAESFLAVRPPEYFPGVSYVASLLRVDDFVLADHWQYVRQSRQNRTRLRNPTGVQWMTVPLVGGQFGRAASEVRIDDRSDWQRRHLKALRFNYGSTPFFREYIDPITQVIGAQHDTLSSLTISSVRLVADLVYATTRLIVGSSLTPPPDSLDAAAGFYPNAKLVVSSAVDRAAFTHAVTFTPEPEPWRQQFPGFFADVSVLDLLFNHGPEARRVLDRLISRS